MNSPWLDLWTLALPSVDLADNVTRWAGVLSASERARAARYHHPERSAQAVAGRALLRNALSYRVARSPASWDFQVDAHGRPYISKDIAQIDFNIAHTEGMVVCAVSSGFPIGADVEHANRAADMVAVTDRFLSKADRCHWTSKKGRDADDFLVRLWTLKEAWAKAKGLGLQIDFTELTIEMISANDSRLLSDDTWRLVSRERASGHIVSLAWQSTEPVEPVWREGANLVGLGL